MPTSVADAASGLSTICLVGMCAAAAYIDVRESRIPNRITVSGFAIALLLKVPLGWIALAAGLLGAVLAFGVTVPLFLARALGGGDVKLLIAVGAFLGPQRLLIALLATMLIGGAMALLETVRRGVIGPVLLKSRDLLLYLVTLGRRGSADEISSPGAITVPYGVAIALGSLAGLLL